VGAGRKAVEGERPDAHAHESQRRQSHGRRHAAHLAIASLADFQFEPIGGQLRPIPYRRIARPQRRLRDKAPRTGRAGNAVVEQHTVLEFADRVGGHEAVHLRPIHFFHRVARIRDARLQSTVIGQQQEPLAVVIESPGRMKIGRAQVIRERGAILLGRETRQNAVRLVEEQQSHRRRVAQLPCSRGTCSHASHPKQSAHGNERPGRL
jgi:hypothetical protein